MPNDKLDLLFRHCINGTGPDGWQAKQTGTHDILSNKDGHRWVRKVDSDDPWIDVTGQ